MSRPFAIGRVLDRRSDKTLLIDWYGNELRQLEGTYRPEWRVPVGKDRGTRAYYSEHHQEEKGVEPYTSDTVGQRITVKNIVHHGFKLTFDDLIPVAVKRLMHANERIGWSIPKRY
jgi:hypothetical protein